jgi:hypothetical protein
MTGPTRPNSYHFIGDAKLPTEITNDDQARQFQKNFNLKKFIQFFTGADSGRIAGLPTKTSSNTWNGKENICFPVIIISKLRHSISSNEISKTSCGEICPSIKTGSAVLWGLSQKFETNLSSASRSGCQFNLRHSKKGEKKRKNS